MNKEILLVAINAKYIHSNLAVYSLKAAVTDYSLKAAVTDYSDHIGIAEYTINNRIEEILDDIYVRKPGMIGFSCYIWNIEYMKKLIVEVHKLLPQCKIWLGGPEVSYNPDYYLDKYDFITGIIEGEGENIFSEVVTHYFHMDNGNSSASYEDIPGVYTYTSRNPQKPEPVDMSAIPFVYKDLEDFQNRIIYYESSRGCPYSCSYCLSSIDKKLRFRDIELVERELGFFMENKVPQVKFVDRTFNCHRERSKRIWRYILENDNGITNFHFEISADLIDEEQIDILNKMRPGLVQLEIGVQTTNTDTIKAIRRKMDLEKLRAVVERLNAPRNIHLHLDLIAGLPFEDMKSFKKSFNDVYNMKPDELQLGFLKVLHGAYMYEDAKKYGIAYKEFPPYEVLYTEWMSYDHILSLKKIEEVLEIYFGSGQFENSVSYLIRFFETPYDFYNALGTYYSVKSKKGEKHSRIDRYKILLEFACQSEDLQKAEEFDGEVLKQLLTFDIYVRENMKTRPEFAEDITPHREIIKELARKHQLEKSKHIEPVLAKTLGYIDAQSISLVAGQRDDVSYIAFDYEDRNPINYNAKITILV